jgi:hypothetical protein
MAFRDRVHEPADFTIKFAKATIETSTFSADLG